MRPTSGSSTVRGLDDPAAAYKFDLQGYIKIKGCVMHRWAPSLRCCRYQCSTAAAVSSAVGVTVSGHCGRMGCLGWLLLSRWELCVCAIA